MSLLFEQETNAILGACFEVYREKGCGFLEAVYQECLAFELGLQNIPFAPHPALRLCYKGRALLQSYQPDFICFDKIILEIKAVSGVADEHPVYSVYSVVSSVFETASSARPGC
jgi:GxxExxY protein